ncbi:sensor histidine kinase [Agaribacterium sp. ZY112]|uniref:sensor histidine kinase n=1 Tax=Agaribacterium sp. ZY112 TaxID=3233574 RepID=UPI003523E691
MSSTDYKAAYLRQKEARIKAEQLLEDRSRELYDSNQTLIKAYDKLKKTNAKLLHQEKLASIGQLSAGVAHEINNPAGYVKSNLNSLTRYICSVSDYLVEIEKLSSQQEASAEQVVKLKEEYDIDYIMGDLKEILDDSLEGMERVASIVQSLKDFARPDTEESEAYDINHCIDNTLKLVNNEIKYKAEINIQYGQLPMVVGQAGNMGQVILNLLMNAAQAIENRGTITIQTEFIDQYVNIKITDTGTGIPKDIQSRIFDPFFTTKKVGDGTGLGLSIVHSIIKKQGGDIHIQSEVNKGTEFNISLPVEGPQP